MVGSPLLPTTPPLHPLVHPYCRPEDGEGEWSAVTGLEDGEGEWSAVRVDYWRGGVVSSKGGLEDGEGEWSAVGVD